MNSEQMQQPPTSVELQFVLTIEDGWPPVAIEGLPATPLEYGYRVEAAPLFVKGLSVGDIIYVTRNAEGNVSSWGHLKKSNRTTIWLLRVGKVNPDDIQRILQELRALKCKTVQLPQCGTYSIDVPAECPMEEVDACLEQLDKESVAVAYPSFRHNE